MRGCLGVRDTLVRTRTRYISLIRALLRQHGYRVPSDGAEGFLHRVRAQPMLGRLLSLIAPLLGKATKKYSDGEGKNLEALVAEILEGAEEK